MGVVGGGKSRILPYTGNILKIPTTQSL
jgi:hypothetical protein